MRTSGAEEDGALCVESWSVYVDGVQRLQRLWQIVDRGPQSL